ncbi:MAG: SDR family oxidoreductase [Sedimentisphaerales bacterium]|nr:SDR family oxidoreductase [Sedimentisphaerales bacterium]
MRNTKDTVLLTGITGNLGSWLAVELLRRGNKVLALMRDHNRKAAERRLNRILNIAAGSDLKDNIEIIQGDICAKGLGLKSDAKVLNRLSKIIHCAACTKFLSDDGQSHQMMNVQGTLNILELANRLSIPVAHVSSAYIAGKRTGVVKEDEIDLGQSFNNIYEDTKCRSEMLVHNWAQENSLPAVVLRPSIVLGDSLYGKTVRFASLYDYMRVLVLIVPRLGDSCVRVVTKPDVTKNIIPVDYFAKVASHIINSGVPGTYHITNPVPLAIKDFGRIFSRLFGLHHYKLVKPDSFLRQKPNRIERLIQKSTSVYNPYMLSEPVFDRTNTDKLLAGTGIELPPTDFPYFKKLLDYACSVNWQENVS